MRLRHRLAPLPTLLALLALGCAAGPATPDPATPSPSAAAGGPAWWLRLTHDQAVPPLERFGAGPLVVAGDGIGYVMTGPTDAMFPGPLLPNLRTRPISDDGHAAIVAEATRLGLLAGETDVTGGAIPPGGATGVIELVVDGTLVVLRGDPSAHIQCVTTPCEPPPGTPAAFGDLWRRLLDPAPWLGQALGPEAAFVPEAYALLLGPAPVPDPGVGEAPRVLPLGMGPDQLGRPVGAGYRCGIVAGDAADALRPVLQEARQLGQWIVDPAASASFGLAVRPVIAGEDPCTEVFGS